MTRSTSSEARKYPCLTNGQRIKVQMFKKEKIEMKDLSTELLKKNSITDRPPNYAS